MQTRISKRLEMILARVAFDSSKRGDRQGLKDRLSLRLMQEKGSIACQMLASLLSYDEIQRICYRIEQELPQDERCVAEDPSHFYPALTTQLQAAYPTARSISTAHALHYILCDTTTLTSLALAIYGIDASRVERELSRIDHEESIQSIAIEVMPIRNSEPQRRVDHYGVELTRLAREGALDPVVGRDAEIERVVQILSRRRKNNPLLVGEAGVGKSAIVEGLALRMASNQVPHTLLGKRLYALDMAALVAGTKYRGEFEERMQQLLDELHRMGDTVLFIDEMHTIVGAGATQGGLDTANILKPMLARGELQLIGATTLAEYRESIERDAALERRFRRVAVEPTTVADTLQILHRIAPHYAAHHHVTYTDAALEACVTLTERYLPHRFLPDKAIDLLDEVGACRHLRAQQSSGNATTTVDATEVAAVITSMTGIPTERVAGDEQVRLQGLRQHLDHRVVGQTEAVEAITRTILRSRVGLREGHRPQGVFLFVGPTGVGKTLLAKELSHWLFGEGRGLIRIDMSEYGEKHNVSRLIGSPPGYVGYGEGGQLTEAVRRTPYAVVLLDEIEKAHPEVFQVMLQLFDEGILTDGVGRRVDFRNTIVIMTSNLGSREVASRKRAIGYATATATNQQELQAQSTYRAAIARHFAPEFLNRIDNVILFRTLTEADMTKIVELELASLAERAAKLGYCISFTPEAKQRLAQQGYTAHDGARVLRRMLRDQVEEPLSALIVDGRITEGMRVRIIPSDEGVQLKWVA